MLNVLGFFLLGLFLIGLSVGNGGMICNWFILFASEGVAALKLLELYSGM